MLLDEDVVVGVVLSSLHRAVIDVALLLHVRLKLVVRVAHLIEVKEFHRKGLKLEECK